MVICAIIYGLPKKGGQIIVRYELMPDGGQLAKKPDCPAKCRMYGHPTYVTWRAVHAPMMMFYISMMIL